MQQLQLNIARDANKIRSRLGNPEVPKEVSNRVTGFVHEAAWQRHKAYSNLAYILRTTKGLNTKIYHGKSDFLLLAKSKSDKTKWNLVAPRIVDTTILPGFNVGKISPEESEYFLESNKDKYEETIERSKKMKKQIEEEEARLIRAEQNDQMIIDDIVDMRDLPCDYHQSSNCTICFNEEEDQTTLENSSSEW